VYNMPLLASFYSPILTLNLLKHCIGFQPISESILNLQCSHSRFSLQLNRHICVICYLCISLLVFYAPLTVIYLRNLQPLVRVLSVQLHQRFGTLFLQLFVLLPNLLPRFAPNSKLISFQLTWRHASGSFM
jgi:hypothetical protein